MLTSCHAENESSIPSQGRSISLYWFDPRLHTGTQNEGSTEDEGEEEDEGGRQNDVRQEGHEAPHLRDVVRERLSALCPEGRKEGPDEEGGRRGHLLAHGLPRRAA